MHAVVLLAIASQAVIAQLTPWKPPADADVQHVAAIDLTIVRPAPAPPPPDPVSLSNLADRIPTATPAASPAPPFVLPEGPDLASALPPPEPQPAPALAPQPEPAPAPKPAPPKPQAKPQAKPQPKPQLQSAAELQRSREDYLLQVIHTLARSPYIPRMHLASTPGVVVTRLTFSADGRLLEAELTRSSGYPELDNGTMEAIRRAGPFPPPPRDAKTNDGPNSAGDRYTITVPIRFRPVESSSQR